MKIIFKVSALLMMPFFSLSSYGTVDKEYLISMEVNGAKVPVSLHKQIIKADYAYDIGLTGKGVKIGVIDVGEYNVLGNHNVIIRDLQPTSNINSQLITTEEDKNHPAHVVSNINHSEYGVAPQSIVYLSKIEYRPDQEFFTLVGEAIVRMVDEKVDYISLSLGGTLTEFTSKGKSNLLFPKEIKKSLLYARDRDVGVVMAASNDHTSLGETIYPYIDEFLKEMDGHFLFALGESISHNGEIRYKESNYIISQDLIPYCLSAPAQHILSLDNNGQEVTWEGTSASTPIIIGGAALIKERFPTLSSKEIFKAMCLHARKIPLEKVNLSFEDYLKTEGKSFVERRNKIEETHISRAPFIIQRVPVEKKKSSFNEWKNNELKKFDEMLQKQYQNFRTLEWMDFGSGILDLKGTIINLEASEMSSVSNIL